MSEATLAIEGMNCASCVSHVQKAIAAVTGVRACSVNLAAARAVVEFDSAATTPEQLIQAVRQSGYDAQPAEAAGAAREKSRLNQRRWLHRALAGFILWLPLEAAHWIMFATHTMRGHWAVIYLSLITATLAIFYVGSAFYRSAFKALRHGATNMDTLIALGASVAYIYSLIALAGFLAHFWHTLPALYFMESTGLLALVSAGHYLEARARRSAGSAIQQLLELSPITARRQNSAGNEFVEVPAAELKMGDLVLVRPGDRIPIDGAVIEGHSSVDESMLSGESLPISRQPGDAVIGGTLNLDGRLIVRVQKTGAQTALAQIISLVESAQSAKPPVQKLADRISAIFVPSILFIALATAIAWYLWGTSHDWPAAHTWGALANAVCSVLIIACPCALGLALPAAIMVGTGVGARRGILIRDIDALQNAERVQTVVLDKTGTLTQGRPVVTSIHPADGTTIDQLLQLAAAAEQYSEHPLAKAIVAEARRRNLEWTAPTEFINHPGQGIIARIDNQTILAGNTALFAQESRGVRAPFLASVSPNDSTFVHIARQNGAELHHLGTIHLSDAIKHDSVAAVNTLHAMNLKTVLLTGDNLIAAQHIARSAGITDVRADVHPAQKAQVIRDLQSTGRMVAMIGDGINDAPALAQADLGIAMGTGSDIAKETGNIVLVHGSIADAAAAIRLSQATMSIIRQNLFLAFAYNILAIPLAAFGLLNPLIAAAAMALSDISVIGNALRLRFKKID